MLNLYHFAKSEQRNWKTSGVYYCIMRDVYQFIIQFSYYFWYFPVIRYYGYYRDYYPRLYLLLRRTWLFCETSQSFHLRLLKFAHFLIITDYLIFNYIKRTSHSDIRHSLKNLIIFNTLIYFFDLQVLWGQLYSNYIYIYI